MVQGRGGRFVDRIPYVTSPGRVVSTVASERGLFRKEDGELVLAGYVPQEGMDEEAAVREIKALVGWELRVAPDLARLEPPTAEELRLLRVYDPKRQFLGKEA